MSVQARLKCVAVTDQGTQRNVLLEAVYTDDKNSPNYSFSQYTPSARMEMVITNPAAFEQFEEGKIYDLNFSEYKEAPQEEQAEEGAQSGEDNQEGEVNNDDQ